MWRNIIERGRPQVTTWRMRVSCWIPKVTNTHSEYIYCFSTATMVARTRLSGWLRLKCDGTRWRTGGEVKGKLTNGVGRQYSSHYLRNMVYPALLPLMRTPRLPVVDWTDAPADLNGLVRFANGRNLVSARVPSRFKRSLRCTYIACLVNVWHEFWFGPHLSGTRRIT